MRLEIEFYATCVGYIISFGQGAVSVPLPQADTSTRFIEEIEKEKTIFTVYSVRWITDMYAK